MTLGVEPQIVALGGAETVKFVTRHTRESGYPIFSRN